LEIDDGSVVYGSSRGVLDKVPKVKKLKQGSNMQKGERGVADSREGGHE